MNLSDRRDMAEQAASKALAELNAVQKQMLTSPHFIKVYDAAWTEGYLVAMCDLVRAHPANQPKPEVAL